jgi:hypothetical protein
VVDIAYLYGGKNPSLLSIAKKQGRVRLNNTGMAVALGIMNNLEKVKELEKLREKIYFAQKILSILEYSEYLKF